MSLVPGSRQDKLRAGLPWLRGVASSKARSDREGSKAKRGSPRMRVFVSKVFIEFIVQQICLGSPRMRVSDPNSSAIRKLPRPPSRTSECKTAAPPTPAGVRGGGPRRSVRPPPGCCRSGRHMGAPPPARGPALDLPRARAERGLARVPANVFSPTRTPSAAPPPTSRKRVRTRCVSALRPPGLQGREEGKAGQDVVPAGSSPQAFVRARPIHRRGLPGRGRAQTRLLRRSTLSHRHQNVQNDHTRTCEDGIREFTPLSLRFISYLIPTFKSKSIKSFVRSDGNTLREAILVCGMGSWSATPWGAGRAAESSGRDYNIVTINIIV